MLSPSLERLAHRGVNDAITGGARGYVAMLRRALGEAPPADPAPSAPAVPTLRTRPVVLTPASPRGELLDVLAPTRFAGGTGGIFTVDTRAFPDGGTLTMTIRVGGSAAAGSFELMSIRRDGEHVVARPVAKAHGVEPATSRRVVHRFAHGERFWFGAWRADGAADDSTNAFQVLVEVKAAE